MVRLSVAFFGVPVTFWWCSKLPAGVEQVPTGGVHISRLNFGPSGGGCPVFRTGVSGVGWFSSGVSVLSPCVGVQLVLCQRCPEVFSSCRRMGPGMSFRATRLASQVHYS